MVLFETFQIFTLQYILPSPLPPAPESPNCLSTKHPLPPGLPLKLIQDPSSIDLSVVTPAYNEEKCLKDGLKNALDWLQKLNKSYEVLIADDRSKDETVKEAIQLAFDHQDLIQKTNPNVDGEIRVI